MKRVLAFLILLSVITTPAYAIIDPIYDEVLSSYEGTELPGLAGRLLANERANIYVSDEFKISLLTSDGVIMEIGDILENPTVNVQIDEGVIERVMESEDPQTVFTDAFDNKEIRIEAVGTFKKLKFGLVSFFGRLFL